MSTARLKVEGYPPIPELSPDSQGIDQPFNFWFTLIFIFFLYFPFYHSPGMGCEAGGRSLSWIQDAWMDGWMD